MLRELNDILSIISVVPRITFLLFNRVKHYFARRSFEIFAIKNSKFSSKTAPVNTKK